MSNPAQPSFVWQLYHYDLEPNASLYAVMHAAESVHIQYNQSNGDLQVINNLPEPQTGLTAEVRVYRLDGSLAYHHETPVTAAPEAATSLGPIAIPPSVNGIHFIDLDLKDDGGRSISRNFYWEGAPGYPDNFAALGTMQKVQLEASVSREDDLGKRTVTVTLTNPSTRIAVMTHLQLRRKSSGARVLPVYTSDNYISLVPGESRTVTLEADTALFGEDDALVTVDGWNVTVAPASAPGVSIDTNLDAEPDHSPATGLPFQTENLR